MKLNNITVFGLLHRVLEWWHQYELRRIIRKIPGACELIVQKGPFRGLQFSPTVDPTKNLPKIIGCFEMELHDTIKSLIAKDFRLLLNIGAAEGYYAVGMAIRMPMCKVVAFERNDLQAQRCFNTAQLNSVADRVVVLGNCTESSLMEYQLENALIIMDCEGAEVDILSEKILPKLEKTWLLVELHDALRPGASRTLWQRFQQSHSIAFIKATDRNQDNFITTNRGFSLREKILAVSENRLGIQEWAVMTPKIY